MTGSSTVKAFWWFESNIRSEREIERTSTVQRHQQQPSWQNFPPCKTFIFSLSYYLLFHPASEWQIHHAPFKISSPRPRTFCTAHPRRNSGAKIFTKYVGAAVLKTIGNFIYINNPAFPDDVCRCGWLRICIWALRASSWFLLAQRIKTDLIIQISKVIYEVTYAARRSFQLS